MYWSPDHRAENAYYVGECPNWVYPREWNRYEEPPWSYAPGRHNQRSAGVHMEAGKVYYVEVLHKQCSKLPRPTTEQRHWRRECARHHLLINRYVYQPILA